MKATITQTNFNPGAAALGRKGGRLKVSVPPTMEQGSYVCIADNKADALWQYNSARAHDGLESLKRMPNGTEYKTVKGGNK